MKITIVLACTSMLLSFGSAAQEPVLSARQRPLGSVVTISGLLLNGSELGIIRYLQDSTAGIAIYPGGNSPASFQGTTIGDEISVTGVLSAFHGLLEINPILSWTKLSSGHVLPDPEDVRLDGLSYHDQGSLVRLGCVQFEQTQSTFVSGTQRFVTSRGERSSIYLENGNPLLGTPIPQGTVDMVAIVSHYDGLRFLIRSMSDFTNTTCLSVLPTPVQSRITQSGFDVSWESNASADGFVIVTDEEGSRLIVSDISEQTSQHYVELSELQPAEFYAVSAGVVDVNGDTALFPPIQMSTQSSSSGSIEVYFNLSVDTTFSNGAIPAGTSFGSMLNSVLGIIQNAEQFIDVAMYNSNRPDIITALKDAAQRGVRIRYIGDADQSNTALNPLPGFPVMLRSGSGIMHHKFIVADAHDPDLAVVWAGSTNHSTNQLSWDPNNAIVIRDQALAKAYLYEFEEMWGGSGALPNSILSRTGESKTDDTPHLFNINDKHVEVYFSPSDGTNAEIFKAIESAESSIEVGLLLLTRHDLTAAMTAKANDGVGVRVIVNDIESSASTFQALINGGVLATEYTLNPIFHHKYAIIDEGLPGTRILTGSHNWTTSATTINDENTLVIFDPDIANIYRQEFEARWAEVYTTDTENATPLSIVVFPNPAHEVITALSDEEIQSIVVTNMIGQSIIHSFRGQTIDISYLPGGLYFLQVEFHSGREALAPFVKQ